MKKYCYIVTHYPRSKTGSPNDALNVYRIKDNNCILINKEPVQIGYKDHRQAVCDSILEFENGWKPLKESDIPATSKPNETSPGHIRTTTGMHYQAVSWAYLQKQIQITELV